MSKLVDHPFLFGDLSAQDHSLSLGGALCDVWGILCRDIPWAFLGLTVMLSERMPLGCTASQQSTNINCYFFAAAAAADAADAVCI